MTPTLAPSPDTAHADTGSMLAASRRRADIWLSRLLGAHLLLSLVLAPFHGTWLTTLFVALPASAIAVALGITRPGHTSTRFAMGALFMVYSGILIHQSMGMIEFHFHIFGSLAFLLMYRDWRVPVVAAAVITVHHLGFHFLQMSGLPVYIFPPTMDHSFSIVLLHAGFVVYETAVLVYISIALLGESMDADESRTLLDRLSRGDLADAEGSGAIAEAFARAKVVISRLSDRVLGAADAVRDGQEGVAIDLEGLEGVYRDIAMRINGLVSGLEDTRSSLHERGVEAEVFRTELSDMADALADRDLTTRLDGDETGTYGRIRVALNASIADLATAFSEVATTGEQVASASDQITAASQDLAQSTSEQASSLEEVTSSLQELSGLSRANSTNAKEASSMARESSSSLEEASRRMEELSDAVDSIKSASDDTAKIVKTIDEIAFQTNLLALNAAVEAARAGDAGKGFAVVAEEVRALALRSAEAARETARLIEGAVESAEVGVGLNQRVRESLERVGQTTRRSDEVMAEIASSSEQQFNGVEQINGALEQISAVTQRTAANSEEGASTAHELSSQATRLHDLVAGFKVDGATRASAPAGRGGDLRAPTNRVAEFQEV